MAAKVIAEIKQSIAQGLYDKLHRVARRFWDDCLLHAQLVEYVEDIACPLHSFPFLFCELRSYALCSLVCRRVEGIHSIMNTINQKGHATDLVKMSCVLRRPALKELLQNNSFLQWLETEWNKRDMIRRYIACLFNVSQKWRLRFCSIAILTRIWYQCCDDSAMLPQKADAHAASEWHKLQRLSPSLEVKHIAISMVAELIRRRFECNVGIWSVPAEWFDRRLDPPPPDHLLDSLQLVATSPPAPVDGERILFFVANARPEKKHLVIPAHLLTIGLQVYVVRVNVVATADNELTFTIPSFISEPLCVSRFATPAALSQIEFWPKVNRAIVHALTDSVQASLLEHVHLEPQTALEYDGMGVDAAALSIVPAEMGRSFQQRCLDLSVVLYEGANPMSKVQLLERCAEARATDVDVLVATGVMEAQPDEFGCNLFTLCEHSLHRSWKRTCVDGMPLVGAPVDVDAVAKLDLVMQLFRNGWRHVHRMRVESYVADGDKVFPASMLSRSREYFAKLCRAGELFEAGLLCIRHQMPEGYYLCCGQLKDKVSFQDRPDILKLRNTHFLQILKGDRVGHVAPAASCDVELDGGVDLLAVMGGDAAPDMDDALALVGPLPSAAAGVEDWSPIVRGACIVSFDNCSHASGIRRAYVNCSTHGLPCQRWAQINKYEDLSMVCGYLFAWNELGPLFDQSDHTSGLCQPDHVDVVRFSVVFK